jgi:hypothetical protein
MRSGDDEGDSGDHEDDSEMARGPGSSASPELRAPLLRLVASPGVGRNWGRFWKRENCEDDDVMSFSSESSDGGGSDAEHGPLRPPALCTLEAFVLRAVELGGSLPATKRSAFAPPWQAFQMRWLGAAAVPAAG